MNRQPHAARLLVGVFLIGGALSCWSQDDRHSHTASYAKGTAQAMPVQMSLTDGAIEDWARTTRIRSVDFRAAHLLDVSFFLNETARQDDSMNNVAIVTAVHNPAISSATASKRVSLTLRDATFLQIFKAVALQLDVDFKYTNGMVVFCDRGAQSQAVPAEVSGRLHTEKSEVDPRLLNVTRTNGSVEVALAVKRWSKGLAFIDTSVRSTRGVIWLSFQVVYNARPGGILVDDAVRWSLDTPADARPIFRVIREPDGIGHLDYLRHSTDGDGFRGVLGTNDGVSPQSQSVLTR